MINPATLTKNVRMRCFLAWTCASILLFQPMQALAGDFFNEDSEDTRKDQQGESSGDVEENLQYRGGYATAGISSGHVTKECEGAAQKWRDAQHALAPASSLDDSDDLLYFLHVPRTGGRTFHQCFLRKLIAERDHCPPSYDVANFSRHEQLPAFHTCKIMASHEDYSTVPPLQAFRKPAVITQLRDPVDRVLSSYEFALEVALRSAIQPPSRRQKRGMPAPRKANGKIPTQTVDVWPWSELVPMLLEDMTARYERGDWPTHPPYKPPPDADPDPDQEYIHTANAVVSPLNSINQSFTPYDNSYFMPLHDFVQHPLVKATVHNGAAAQFVSLSHSVDDATLGMKKCYDPTRRDMSFREVARYAHKRLSDMAFVSLTPRVNDGGRLLAHLKGWDLSARVNRTKSKGNGNEVNKNVNTNINSNNNSNKNEVGVAQGYHPKSHREREQDPHDPHRDLYEPHEEEEPHVRHLSNWEGTAITRDTTIPVSDAISSCIRTARNKYRNGREATFKKALMPFRFSKDGREQLPNSLVVTIQELNKIDMELYRQAQVRFTKHFDRASQEPNFPAPIANTEPGVHPDLAGMDKNREATQAAIDQHMLQRERDARAKKMREEHEDAKRFELDEVEQQMRQREQQMEKQKAAEQLRLETLHQAAPSEHQQEARDADATKEKRRPEPERETAAQEKSAGQVPEAEAMGLPVPAKRLEPRKMVRNWWDGLVGAFGGHKEDQNSNKLVVPKPEMEANHDEKKAQDPKPVPDNDPGDTHPAGIKAAKSQDDDDDHGGRKQLPQKPHHKNDPGFLDPERMASDLTRESNSVPDPTAELAAGSERGNPWGRKGGAERFERKARDRFDKDPRFNRGTESRDWRAELDRRRGMPGDDDDDTHQDKIAEAERRRARVDDQLRRARERLDRSMRMSSEEMQARQERFARHDHHNLVHNPEHAHIEDNDGLR